MHRGPPFIEYDEFKALVDEIPSTTGEPYKDIRTAYSDMSRLVVAWLARSSPEELKALYNDLGWGSDNGGCNVRQLRLAAKLWLNKYHQGRFPFAEGE